MGLGGIEGFFLELKDRITPHVNFFQKARSKCENEMRKAGERKDVVCERVVCEKVVCDNVVCVKELCVKELCVTMLCVTILCVTILCVTLLCV